MTLQEFYRQAGVQEADEMAFAAEVELPKEPWPHQIAGLNRALCDTNFALFDEPGVGKTLPSQAWLLYYAYWGNKCVVIMPPVLLDQYEESLRRDYPGLSDRFHWHILDDPPAARKKLYAQWDETGWPHIMMVSYQMFLRQHAVLIDKGYCVAVADEAQALRNTEAKTHQAVKKLVRHGALLPMTGTPNHNSLMDSYGMTQLLDDTTYPSLDYFKRKHCVQVLKSIGKSRRVFEVIGFKDKPTISANLYRHARRVTKEEAFPNLQTPMIDEIPVKLHPKHKMLYDKLVMERFLEVDGEIIDALTAQSLRMKCLQLASTPEAYVDTGLDVPNAIMEAVDTLLDGIAIKTQDKCILFCGHRRTIQALTERYRHLNPAVIYGGVSRAKKGEARRRFINDPDCRLVVANYNSAGAGIDGWQDVCRYAIFVEPCGVPGTFKQACERLHRPGQEKVVTVWIIKALATAYVSVTRKMLIKEKDNLEVSRDRTSLLGELLGQV